MVILAVIVLILAYILFIPVKVDVNMLIDKKMSAVTGIKAFPFEYKFAPGKAFSRDQKPPKDKKTVSPVRPGAEIKKRRIDSSKLTTVDIGLLFGIVSEFFGFLGRLFKAPDRYFVRAELSGGLSEPDITGELYGAYQAIMAIMPGSIKVDYRPDFISGNISGTVKVGFVVRLINVLKEFVVLIFRLPIIRIIKLYRKIKAKNGGSNV